ncbi:hypothetical protein [Aeromicrobium chenweiae]|uniref:Uncharacterized protein n=1 Tax=Aeromicrobium chenweiae TaxID=2079793 RepID=A0A2S0WQP1_9ACTN|nr:hypothetical protein [Aeromicrobium chenweiae]AWB93656.1 hypothetical protein C3E78_16350 [Aeromicrobium chenweiae]TGN30495.1 hypothetical protein E4L97_17645 [Aeromicrobium chenweiae]
MSSRPGRAITALLLAVAATVLVQPGPAAAAACAEGVGVTVVVGSTVSCDEDGGGTAADSFRDAGHVLTPVQRQPGFVCQVDGVPAGAGCASVPPGDAYWGLFWSDGASGEWSYASQGVGSLKVPDGGWVAFEFQDSTSRTFPEVEPTASAPQSAAPERSAESEGPRPVAATDDSSGSLGWVAGVLALALVGGMAAVLWRRRTAGGPS